MEDMRNKIEAVLFACGRKMSVEELSKVLGIRAKDVVKGELTLLQKDYEQKNSPLMLVEEGNDWKLTTRERYLPLVQQINPHTELSKTLMETLAVIAWKQPILQSEVIRIRTNKAYDHINELMELGFVVKEKYSRTYKLKLTEKFLQYFDLKNADAAKQLFKDIKEETEEQKKVEEFSEAKDAAVKEDKKIEIVDLVAFPFPEIPEQKKEVNPEDIENDESKMP